MDQSRQFISCLYLFGTLLLLFVSISLEARAQTTLTGVDSNQLITIDLSEDHIDIHSGFAGTSVTLFGVQKHAGDIVVVMSGPKMQKILREKSSVAGFWLTTSSVRFIDTPGYYAVASSRNLTQIAPRDILAKHSIGLDFLEPRALDERDYDRDPLLLNRYQDSFIQTQQLNGLFVMRTEDIEYISDELFKLKLWFPSNIPVGEYKVDAFLFSDGEMIGHHHRDFLTVRAGFNASVKYFSEDRPWLYASLMIFIAVSSGWLATILLRRD